MSTNRLNLVVMAMALGVIATGLSVAEEAVYGSQLMTRQERIEHRNAMRTMKTPEERNAYREAHHKQMQERAKEKGVILPDMPPVQGMGGMGGMGPQGGRR